MVHSLRFSALVILVTLALTLIHPGLCSSVICVAAIAGFSLLSLFSEDANTDLAKLEQEFKELKNKVDGLSLLKGFGR